ARIKARAAFEYTGLPAIADDSGLAVDALGGAPGVYSARYCEGTDKDRNAFLLKNMENVPDGERSARFVCALCCVLDEDREIAVEGACEGTILREERGEGGFGYDPLFFVELFGCTFGEVPAEAKHTISHRGRALRKLEEKLRLENLS
ncbi:MAG: RdgB/HAM1 family non-canonical purine NTP pyrophosphatase, partial [Butyricicoccus sp.]|nr:RdgB/HAM1 family non-canonical purine NTP pyrophosphatase [Butyricicoccus sp.]